MARFDHGWVKVYRQHAEVDFGNDGYVFAIYVKLTLWANLKETKVKNGGKYVAVPRGSILTSIKEIETSTRFHRDTIRRALKWLTANSFITSQRLYNAVLISISSFDALQTNPQENKTQENAEKSDGGRHESLEECHTNTVFPKNDEKIQKNSTHTNTAHPTPTRDTPENENSHGHHDQHRDQHRFSPHTTHIEEERIKNKRNKTKTTRVRAREVESVEELDFDLIWKSIQTWLATKTEEDPNGEWAFTEWNRLSCDDQRRLMLEMGYPEDTITYAIGADSNGKPPPLDEKLIGAIWHQSAKKIEGRFVFKPSEFSKAAVKISQELALTLEQTQDFLKFIYRRKAGDSYYARHFSNPKCIDRVFSNGRLIETAYSDFINERVVDIRSRRSS